MADEQPRMKAQEFIALLSNGEGQNWRSSTVLGEVDASCRSFVHRLTVREVTFENAVNLSNCRFERGLELIRCRFKEGLDLRDARVEGPLVLDGSVFGREALAVANEVANPSPTFRSAGPIADFTNLRVMGAVAMMSVRVFGDVTWSHTEIEDDLQLDDTQVHGALTLRRCALGEVRTDTRRSTAPQAEGGPGPGSLYTAGKLDLTGTTIAGDVRLIGAIIGGRLCLQAATIEGNLLCRMEGSAASELRDGASLLGIRVKGNVDFSGTKITGRLSLQSASLGGDLDLRPTVGLTANRPSSITGSAWLLGARIEGSVYVGGAQIEGALMLQNAHIGHNLHAGITSGFRTSIRGAMELNGSTVLGAVQLRGVMVEGQLALDSSTIGGTLSVVYDFNPEDDWKIVRSQIGDGINVQSATIGRGVTLLGVTVDRQSRPERTQASSSSLPPPSRPVLNFSGAMIRSDLIMHQDDSGEQILEVIEGGLSPAVPPGEKRSSLLQEAREVLNEFNGDVCLARSEILGNLLLNGIRVRGELDLRDVLLRANLECAVIDLASTGVAVAAVDRAVLEGIEVRGDVNLTGLTVAGDLLLGYSEVRGRLMLSATVRSKPPQAAAGAAGEGAAAGAATASEPAEPLARIGGSLRLEAATISELIMSGSNLPSPGGSEKDSGSSCDLRVVLERATIDRLEIVKPLPGTLDLQDLRVGSWEEHDQEDFFEDLLERSSPFRKRSFLDIESDLRNRGRYQTADRVHLKMRRKERERKPGLIRFGERLLFDWLIAYGTSSKPLLVVMFVFFVISVGILIDPRHVEVDVSYLSHEPSVAAGWQPTERHPRPENWSLDDAMLLATRLHVPIVSLGIDDDVRAAGPWWVESYAVFATAFSWVAWPLFQASVSGFLRRRT